MTKEQIKEFTFRTSNANQSGLMIILFDMEKVYITDALAYFSEGKQSEYIRNIKLAKRVHGELMNGIDITDELGARYMAILRFIYGKLISSDVKGKPDELDRCQIMMDNLREGFKQLSVYDDDEPVMQNTHKVYAGLTYGKGTLNESVEAGDYSKRGFKA